MFHVKLAAFHSLREKITEPPKQAVAIACIALLVAFAAMILVLGVNRGR